MTTLNADDALALARRFRDAANAVGDYLYGRWATINDSDRERLRSLEVTLMNVATDLVTQGVGVVIDSTQASLQALLDATAAATAALKNINDARRAIRIATALIGFAAAIPTGNIGAIYGAFANLRLSVAG